RWLDRDQGRQLQDVALNHVAKSAGSFVEASAAFHAESLRGGNLHVVDIVAIPQWLEDAVAEAEDQKILEGVFGQVVFDAVDLVLVKDIEHAAIQFFCRSEVTAKGLLNDDANPGIRRRRLCQASPPELLDDVEIHFRRRRQVKEDIASKILLRLQLFQASR